MTISAMSIIRCVILASLLLPVFGFGADSVCYGKVSNGRLEGGVQLPDSGKNFVAYSSMGVAAGRTHVHSAVRDIVLDAFTALEQTSPGALFVYGETGWKNGGRIRPHRTHQNGMSVDFMVPVLDSAGKSVPLPGSPFNKFGYGIEFDSKGRYEGLRIDFETLAEHLYQLSIAANKRNVSIALVIFDPPLMPMLFDTKRGPYLRKHVPFMKGNAWIRHDEHYHVDFSVPCKPYDG